MFEGWDAAGKGGAIKRLVAPLDARHVRVEQYAAPTVDEKRHFYLERFIRRLPGLGGMAVFDRTWYGRVLVERIEGYATTEQWQRAYAEIVDFERSLHLEGTIVVKFWLHLSPEEQLRRFKQREKDPLKRWKLTDEDWRNRDRWGEYASAVEEMVERTDTTWAPWHLIAGDNKRFARIAVIDTVIAEIERGCASLGFPLPERRPADAEPTTPPAG
jgi:polyphosphate kinase 2 (PPK2 family)